MFNKTLKPAATCAAFLNIVKNGEDQKIDALPLLKGLVSQNPISAADIKFTYEHWDLVMKLYSQTSKEE